MISLQVGPSVVHIDVRNGQENVLLPPGIVPGRGHGEMLLPEQTGQGSGVVVDPSGYIVTNHHVIEDARTIRVSLSDGRTLPGRIVGVDRRTDIAVLKVEATDLIAAKWGDSDGLDVGALVWAVGSPFGLQSTTTFGIVSGKHRSGMAGDVYQDFLQTDAAVNPGNSGGPLVDATGKIVGINTAILGDAYQGVSFAIPSHVARHAYERLKRDGRVARGWLGVELAELTSEDVNRLSLPEQRGALVIRCSDDRGFPSPAKVAGIQPDDVLVGWEKTDISTVDQLMRAVAATEVGSTTNVRLIREGEEITLEVQVGERPSDLES
jgi:S1-C subfamily serine protease